MQLVMAFHDVEMIDFFFFFFAEQFSLSPKLKMTRQRNVALK